MKKCTKCLEVKASSEFYKNTTSKYKDGIQSQCRSCIVKRSVQRERINPKTPDHRLGKNLRRKYWPDRTWREALSIYLKMLEDQSGRCAVCNSPEKTAHRGVILNLSVDHCHKTGKIRGLLCRNCNVAEGLLKTPERAESLVSYMRFHA